MNNKLFDLNTLHGYDTNEQISFNNINKNNTIKANDLDNIDIEKHNIGNLPNTKKQINSNLNASNTELPHHQPFIPDSISTDLTGETNLIPLVMGDPNYYFKDTISEAVLHRYLDRAINMVGLFEWCYYVNVSEQFVVRNTGSTVSNPILPVGGAPSILTDFGTPSVWIQDKLIRITGAAIDNTNKTFNITLPVGLNYYYNRILNNPHTQMGQDMQMLKNLKPKLLCLTTTMYSLPNNSIDLGNSRPNCVEIMGIEQDRQIEWLMTLAKVNIDYYHTYIDPDTIFQAFIYEIFDYLEGQILIPSSIYIDFGLLPPLTPTHFTKNNVCYLSPSSSDKIDITRIHAQMYYYYIATMFIDAGYESIFFGDIYLNITNDVASGYAVTWNLLKKIRDYAKIHARRGLVICVGTAPVEFYYNPLPLSPLPIWQRQLILDVQRDKPPLKRRYNTVELCRDGFVPIQQAHFPPLPYDPFEAPYKWGTPFYLKPYHPSNYPVEIDSTFATAHILFGIKGGLHPQGWFCTKEPSFLDIDFAIINPGAGCGIPIAPTSWFYQFYGFDIATMFALLSTKHRNLLLIYLWYKIKCINPNCGFVFLGRKPALQTNTYYNHLDHATIYRANGLNAYSSTGALINYNKDLTDIYYQEQVIKDIWNGVFTPTKAWIHHNFTKEKLPETWNTTIKPASDLVFVGNDKIFYIGLDGYIHGYIKVNDFNNGTWLTVSPSYSADGFYGHSTTSPDPSQLISSQLKAVGDLIVSPDKNYLLYIGHDVSTGYNFICAFNIENVWKYRYFVWLKSEFYDARISAVNNLIYPVSDRLYLIVYNALDGTTSVCGIVTDSVSWFVINVSQIASASTFPVDSLAYDKVNNRLYYTSEKGALTTDGYNIGNFHFFKVIDIFNYQYIDCYNLNYYKLSNREIDSLNVSIVGNIIISDNLIYFIGEANTLDGIKRIYQLIDTGYEMSGEFGLFNIPVGEANGLPLYSQAMLSNIPTKGLNKITINADGTKITYFGYVDFPSTKHVLAYYKKISEYEYTYNTIDNIDYNVDFYENSLQYRDNDNIFYISDTDKMIHVIRFEPDFCKKAEEIINVLWPLLPPE